MLPSRKLQRTYQWLRKKNLPIHEEGRILMQNIVSVLLLFKVTINNDIQRGLSLKCPDFFTFGHFHTLTIISFWAFCSSYVKTFKSN